MTANDRHVASNRWEALDALRGLSIVGMLLNLSPGAWEHRFAWLDHAAWEGCPLIDLVFPTFLFCVGAAMPLSFESRTRRGATPRELKLHLLQRTLLLVILGVLLNAYPKFDWAHLRIPGILQRIGLCAGIVGYLLLSTSVLTEGRLHIRSQLMGGVAIAILALYWLMLAVFPVPGFGAPRFDSVGSWPALIDRALFGVAHLWEFGTTNGQVTYDPEGLLSTFPACVNVIAGAFAAYWIRQQGIKRPAFAMLAVGLAMMGIALLLHPVCPIIKKIWTSTFALLSTGASLVALAALTALVERPKFSKWIGALRVLGANALAAFVICWLLMPVADLHLLPGGSLRQVGFEAFHKVLPNEYASFAYSLVTVGFIWVIAWFLYRRRWFIRL